MTRSRLINRALIALTLTFGGLSVASVPSTPLRPGPYVPCELIARYWPDGSLDYKCQILSSCPAPSVCDVVTWVAGGLTYESCGCDSGQGGAAQPACWSAVINGSAITCFSNFCNALNKLCALNVLNMQPGAYLPPCVCR